MTTNPGGQLTPQEVIGRDPFIAQMWRILQKRSAIITAERRMGKTQVVKKMTAEAPEGFLAVYHDLEHVSTPLEFAELTFHDVERHLGRGSRLANKTRTFLAHLQGAELGGLVKFPQAVSTQWKALLTHTIEDLASHPEQLVFFWDEAPLMLHKIARHSGEDEAMELLDLLRSLRATHPRLRMVFTGSIGLHHVLTRLRKDGYANRPTNDMSVIDLPPLAVPDACHLAKELLLGEKVPVKEIEAAAAEVARAADCVPYFIHQLIDALVLEPAKPVQALLDDRLLSSSDPWDICHFIERVPRYYEGQSAAALAVLDAVAATSRPLGYEQIENRVRTVLPALDEEPLRELLVLLQRDHYLKLDTKGRYDFQLSLVRRAWKLQRSGKA